MWGLREKPHRENKLKNADALADAQTGLKNGFCKTKAGPKQLAGSLRGLCGVSAGSLRGLAGSDADAPADAQTGITKKSVLGNTHLAGSPDLALDSNTA